MFCTKCRTQLPEDAAFCHKCGTAVPREAAALDSQASAPEPTRPAAAPAADAELLPGQAVLQKLGAASAKPAQPGSNPVSFTGLSAALSVVEGLVAERGQAGKAGVRCAAAQSLFIKLRTCAEVAARQHGGEGRMGQALSVLQRAGEALLKGKRVADAWSGAQPDSWIVSIELSEEEARLYNLCADQAQLREGLAIRLLRTCRSCRFQRIYNPDYERMMQRRKTIDGLIMLTRSALMALARFSRDPKFVCSRCQGLESIDREIVLCPQCGAPVMDVLLSRCGKCGYDFMPAAEAGPDLRPQRAPGGGKVLRGKCADCGNEVRVPLAQVPRQGLRGKCSECGRTLVIRPRARAG